MKIKNILSALCLLPISIFLIGFVAINNQLVSISFNPFNRASATISLPLCLGLITSLILGFCLGIFFGWIKSYGYKRELRQLRKQKNVQILDVVE